MRKIQFVFIALISIVFYGCERAIPFDLGASANQVVIDAFLNNTSDTQFIYVSKTVGYLESGKNKKYNIDSMSIIDLNDSQVYVFKSVSQGVYFYKPTTDSFRLQHHFILYIKDNNNEYYAHSFMNRTSVIDSIYYEHDSRFSSSPNYQVNIKAKDPVGKDDLRWIKNYRNDTLASLLVLAYDNSFVASEEGDGQQYIVPLSTFYDYRSGDIARVELYSLNLECYYYLKQINTQLNATTGLFAQPVANVYGNIINKTNAENKVLGFFNMGALERKSIVIP